MIATCGMLMRSKRVTREKTKQSKPRIVRDLVRNNELFTATMPLSDEFVEAHCKAMNLHGEKRR